MKMRLKRILALMTGLVLCLFGTAAVQAEKIFGDSFVETCSLPHWDTVCGRSLAVREDTVFQLMDSGEVYAWDPEQDTYSFFAQVPVVPAVDVEIPFSSQDESTRKELTESISCLISGDDGIYGFNNASGKVGPIDGDGWHADDIRLDTSTLNASQTGYSDGNLNTFISDGKMYAFYDLGLYTSKPPQPMFLIFTLSDGSCTTIQMPDTISFCPYTPGKLLCLQDSGTETPVLAVYDISSQQLTELDVTVPVSIPRELFSESWELHSEIGGLAYDATRDVIYLADGQGLWYSAAGAAFQHSPAGDLWETMGAMAQAWVLPSGGYVTENGLAYYVAP